MANKAVIAGASGLTGNHLVELALQQSHYNEVLVVVRKALPIQHKKLVQLVIDFDKLNEFKNSITGDVFFCCLGTTKNKTPDAALYSRIEHDYPVQLAEIAKANGFRQFHLMLSVGADSKSASNYLQLKGRTEEDIQQLDFANLQIYRPSVLTGKRKESRLMENIAAGVMTVINPLLFGGLKKYQSIPAAIIAQAMYKQSLKKEEGTFIHPSHHIKQLA